MEKKLMLPANYNVMNEEEMTYTSGGDGFTAPFAVGWTIGAVISVANLIWGLDQTRTWIKNNKKNGENITDLAAKGINAAADYMGKSIVSVLSACVKCGTEIELVADGNDEAQALQDMVSAVNSGLGE